MTTIPLRELLVSVSLTCSALHQHDSILYGYFSAYFMELRIGCLGYTELRELLFLF